MNSLETVRVELANRSYDIKVGANLLGQAGEFIRPLLRRPFVPIVTDRHVADLHLEALTVALGKAGIQTAPIILPPGEGTKNFAQLEHLLDELLALKVERGDKILAFGGGVIGDLTGFAAAVLRRGTDYVQIPTTLLSQVDSSVGGKTAINSRHGKNLIGSFHQPCLVLADVALLDTLPARELRAGYAEVVKYGLLGDADFFTWLESHGTALIEGDPAARIHAVVAACRHKARIVAEDEREDGVRALLNLGHTFGHAMEADTGFSETLLHGEGVAIGMILAFELSAQLGYCPPADADRVRRHFAATGLPTGTGPNLRFVPETLYHHMRQDKKVRDGQMTFVLVRGIGEAFLSRDVPPEQVMALLQRELAA